MTASVVYRHRVRRTALAVWGLVVAVLLVGCDVSFSMSAGDSAGTFDAKRVGEDIAADLSAQLGGGFEVECPEDQPAEPGLTFACEAVDDHGDVGIIGVTVVDEDGNVDWELLEVIERGAATGGDDAPAVGADAGAGAADQHAGADAAGQDQDPDGTATREGEEAAREAGGDADGSAGAAQDQVDPPLAPEDVPRPAHVPADWVVFAEPGAGVTLWHPADWTADGAGPEWTFDVPSGHGRDDAWFVLSSGPTAAAGGAYPDKFAYAESLLAAFDDPENELLTDGVEVDRIDWQAPRTEVAVLGVRTGPEHAAYGRISLVGDLDEAYLIDLHFIAPVEVFSDLLEDAVIDVLESLDTAPLR